MENFEFKMSQKQMKNYVETKCFSLRREYGIIILNKFLYALSPIKIFSIFFFGGATPESWRKKEIPEVG